MADIGFYRSPLEFDDDLCNLLGVMTARWSMVELAMHDFFCEMLQNENTGTALYYSTGSVRQRVEFLKAAAKTTFAWEEDFDKFSALLSNIYSTFQTRNRLVHSSYQAVITTKDGVTEKWPTIDRMRNMKMMEEHLDYIGYEVPFGDPKPVNKGTFKNHLAKLDDLLSELVDDYMEYYSGLTGDDPEWRDKLEQQRSDKNT